MTEKPKAGGAGPEPEPGESRLALDHIREALRGLQFGEVKAIVQDGVVIQVERTERKRLRKR